jgi:hypothetical protein
VLDPHRLTADDYLSYPHSWTADSRSVIFASLRGAGNRWGIYKQALDGRSPQAIASVDDLDLRDARLSPDGGSLILRSIPRDSSSGSPHRLLRVSVNGGAPQPLFEIAPPPEAPYCTSGAAGFCAYPSRAPDGRSWVITAFDPTDGRRWEWLRIPVEPGADYHWAPSPDASLVAVSKVDWDRGQIRFIPTRGGEARTVTVKGYGKLNFIYWAPDSKSVFVGNWGPGGAALLRVDLAGDTQTVWHQPGPTAPWGIPSPDGRHIALYVISEESNVWMIDGF